MNRDINNVKKKGAKTLMISPNFDSSKLDSNIIEDKIDVYEDRILGWFIEQARALEKEEDSEFAMLQLALTYFEQHAIYLKGEDSEDKSCRFFKDGFLEVFPEVRNRDNSDDFLNAIYKEIRCGLFHDGMTRRRIRVVKRVEEFEAIAFYPKQSDLIYINVSKFIDKIEAHFKKYIAKLRDAKETALRANFERAWDLKNCKIE